MFTTELQGKALFGDVHHIKTLPAGAQYSAMAVNNFWRG